MVFALLVLPAAAAGMKLAVKGIQQLCAARDVKENKLAVLPPQMMSPREIEEANTTEDVERLRQLFRKGVIRYQLVAEMQQRAQKEAT